ncbi:hypothetical protein [Polaribacter sp.]|uniref:hypothetical protein n=1 Tax=Polaribacter sp. TaxID=1920175 RepID=UPI003EF7B0AA
MILVYKNANIFYIDEGKGFAVFNIIVLKLTDYPWSSYFSIISDKKSAIEKDKVIYQFETKENFIDSHQLKIDSIATEKWLNI